MATTITAGNATNGAAISSDSTGILELKSGTGSGTTAMTVSTGQAVTFAQAANLPNTFGFKNRIINGAMMISQRGTSFATPADGAYTLDRWQTNTSGGGVYSVAQSSDAPVGFLNSTLITVTTADASIGSSDYYIFTQRIEGNNTVDFAFGTASAAPVSISFWVKASVTGAYGVSLLAYNASYRTYISTVTVSSANTWEYKTITVSGDTASAIRTNNNWGMALAFDLGCGSSFNTTAGSWTAGEKYGTSGSTKLISTSGATFYITGVQLEKGSTATSFDVRPYGTELQLCQRYYQRLYANNAQKFALARNGNTTEAYGVIPFYVPMRVAPSALEQSGTAANYSITHGVTTTTCSAVPAINSATLNNIEVFFTVASGLTAGQASVLRSLATDQFLGWSAEL